MAGAVPPVAGGRGLRGSRPARSGYSTGRPKLIVSGDPSIYIQTASSLGLIIGAREGATMVMPAPMYHNGPLIWTSLSLLAGAHVVLLPRIWKLPTADRLAYDVSSLEIAFHLAEPCPP